MQAQSAFVNPTPLLQHTAFLFTFPWRRGNSPALCQQLCPSPWDKQLVLAPHPALLLWHSPVLARRSPNAIKVPQTRPRGAHNASLGPSMQLCHDSSRPACIADPTAQSTCAVQIHHHLSKNIQDGEQQAFLRHPPHPLRLHCPMCLPSPNFRSPL